jgi:hypothetical protein
MEKTIVAKINTGKALHVANLGDKSYHIACGSRQHGTKVKIHKIDLEVTKENITCKKCLKALEEKAETKIDTDSQEYRLAKLKEFAANEENEEQEMMAALKKAHENNEQFILKK